MEHLMGFCPKHDEVVAMCECISVPGGFLRGTGFRYRRNPSERVGFFANWLLECRPCSLRSHPVKFVETYWDRAFDVYLPYINENAEAFV